MNGQIDLRFLYGLEYKSKTIEDGQMEVIQFCMDLGLIANMYECPKCEKRMVLSKRIDVIDKYEWVCRVYKAPPHYVKRCLRRGTWFENSKLSLCVVLLMTEYFVRQREQQDIMYELKLSKMTVCDWRSFFREVCVDIVLNASSQIGGEGVIVEIDESKFGKRKYNRGKRVDGKWVFGGIERGTNKCFLRVVEKRDKDTLLDIIKTFVLPGTTIYSDCWKSYDCLEDEGFRHLTVNHSLHFKDPETGVHTNSIEGTWRAIKGQLASRTVTDQFDSYLAEYIWRRNHSDSDDLMRAFLEDIAKVYRPQTRDTE